MKKIRWVTMAAIAVACLTGCEPAGPSFGPQPKLTDFYVPFIESIDAPVSLGVGEHSQLVLHVSTARQPELLADADLVWRVATSGVPGENQLMPYLIGREAAGGVDAPGSPGAAMNVPIFAAAPGILRFEFAGTDKPADGGRNQQINLIENAITCPPPGTAGFAFTLVEIEVLPAD